MSHIAAKRSDTTFLVQHECGAFIVEGAGVSVAPESILEDPAWLDPSLDAAESAEVVRAVERFIEAAFEVLELRTELGSLILRAVPAPFGHRFLMEIVDQSGLLLDEDDAIPPIRRIVISSSLDEALENLDVYPWPCFWPAFIHPSFSVKIYEAFQARMDAGASVREHVVEQWKLHSGS